MSGTMGHTHQEGAYAVGYMHTKEYMHDMMNKPSLALLLRSIHGKALRD